MLMGILHALFNEKALAIPWTVHWNTYAQFDKFVDLFISNGQHFRI